MIYKLELDYNEKIESFFNWFILNINQLIFKNIIIINDFLFTKIKGTNLWYLNDDYYKINNSKSDILELNLDEIYK